MEYIFGTIQKDNELCEILKTKATNDDNIELNGVITVEKGYADNIITDTFIIVNKYKSDTDSEGFVYNWYNIKNHNRYIDKFTPSIRTTEQEITDLEIEIIRLKGLVMDLQRQIDELKELNTEDIEESE